MKTNNVIFLICFALIANVFISCKKDKKDEELTPALNSTIPKIKTISHSDGYNTGTVTITYNSNGSISKYETTDDKMEWTYTSGHITLKMYDNNELILTTVYTLNSSGLATSSTISYSEDTLTATYQYDTSGYLTKETTTGTNYNSVYINTYTNGNLTSVALTGTNNGQSTSSLANYEHYAVNTNTIGVENMGITFFGKKDKNLIKSFTTTIDGNSSTFSCTYEYDSKNRVSKKTQTQTTGGTYTKVETFTYTD